MIESICVYVVFMETIRSNIGKAQLLLEDVRNEKSL
jgi:hypothetical protein